MLLGIVLAIFVLLDHRRSNKLTEGFLIIATFSENGPEKYSGIRIHQYSEEMLTEHLKPFFEKARCFTSDHVTLSDKKQNFLYCVLKRR